MTASLVEGTRETERDDEHGWITQARLAAQDTLGRTLHAIGTAVSRIVINRHTFIDINSLVRWEMDGATGWGEDQDMWPVHRWSRVRREGAGGRVWSAPPMLRTSRAQVATLSRTTCGRWLRRRYRRGRASPGRGVKLSLDFGSLAWAETEHEYGFLVRALMDRGLLRHNTASGVEITPDGWDYLDEHRTPDSATKQVFVAMSFHASMNAAWEDGIKPALESVGYRPHRVDMTPHLERIDAKIQADIKGSRFVVADVTRQPQGVYFEAGYAMGLRRPVVWTVKKNALSRVHFDTRQFNHIVWRDPADLQAQLKDTVVAVLGRGS